MSTPDDVEITPEEPLAPAPMRPAKGQSLAEAKAKAEEREEVEVEFDSPVLAVIREDPGAVLAGDYDRSALYAEIRRLVDEFKPDLSTAAGRKKVAGLAYKITRTKTAIDDAGKELNAEIRKRIEQVDERRREVRSTLDELRDEARKPLTEWEEAEQERWNSVRFVEGEIGDFAHVSPTDTAAGIEQKLRALTTMSIEPAELGAEDAERLDKKRLEAIPDLTLALEKQRENERQAAELAEFRRREAERRAEDEARAKAEAARKAEQEAEENRKKQEAIAAEQKREDERRAAKEAQEAQEARHRQETATAEKFGELNAIAHEVLDASIDRLQVIQDSMIGSHYPAETYGMEGKLKLTNLATALAGKAAERLKDLVHERNRVQATENRQRVNLEVRDALIENCGLAETLAERVVTAIHAGKIPHTTINL